MFLPKGSTFSQAQRWRMAPKTAGMSLRCINTTVKNPLPSVSTARTSTTKDKVYPATVPVLKRLELGAYECNAPALLEGQALDANNIILSKRQLVWRETMALQHPPLVKVDELVEAEQRHDVVKAMHFDLPAPRWAQTMQQSLLKEQQEHKAETNRLLKDLQDQQAQQGKELRAVLQLTQKATNRGNKKNNECLTPVIRLEDGAVPPNFPRTTTSLMANNSTTLDSLLRFYGLPEKVIGETVSEKKERLLEFFGVNI